METLLQIVHNTFVTLLILGVILFMLAVVSGADDVTVNVAVDVNTSSGSDLQHVSDPYRPLPTFNERPVYVPYWVQRSGDCLTRRDYYDRDH